MLKLSFERLARGDSHRKLAGVLKRAKALEVNNSVIDPRSFESEELYITSLFSTLDEHEIDFIALAGYLKMVQPELIDKYRNKITNIHPALLPSFGGKGFYGMKVHEAVIEAGCKVSGVTIHLVNEKYDRGAIIAQRTLRVLDDDSPESLAERVLKIEHEIYPEALQLFEESRVQVINSVARIIDKA